MNDNYLLKVKINSKRPDFRVFGTYFFGDDFHNYDSEGNSFPVSSREWTELYMCSRQIKDLWFDISWINKDDTSILEVTSNKIENVYIIAYFLAKETNGEVFDNTDKSVPLETLKLKMGDFELERRLQLAEQSIWRKSSETNPYPNLEIT
ncbi:hypothetical protein [Bacteroides sp. 519]|uniref:hypothetical protein n=1 Tax=Bacteroides sp. 519 TaxID=2302937 RepID=UPI0013D7D132|nr:hypothetical protein [Bacteroides sp. 519]NDV60548.1 hypothetical protein [Bacteroides sp. 519]